VAIGKTTRFSETVPIVVTEPEPPEQIDLSDDVEGRSDPGAVARWTLIGAAGAIVLIVLVSFVLSRRGRMGSGG
jgi:hypothetical protein